MIFYINSIHFLHHLLILQSGLILILVSLIFDPISFIDFWYNHILLRRNLPICEPFIKILKNRHGCRWSLTFKKPKYVHADKLQKLDKQVLTESLNWCPLLTRCLRGASAMLTRSYVHKLLFFGKQLWLMSLNGFTGENELEGCRRVWWYINPAQA